MSLPTHSYHGYYKNDDPSTECCYLGDCWKSRIHPVHQGEPVFTCEDDE